MALFESPPFPLGSTLYGGNAAAIASGALDHIAGYEHWFLDNDETTSFNTTRSSRWRRFRAVKNTLGASAAALPKIVYALGTHETRITAAAALGLPGNGKPVDEHLPAAGCPNGDICWVCVEGPAICITDAGGSPNIADGAMVRLGSDGKVRHMDTTATGANVFEEVNSRLGRSVHGSTVNTNDAEVLVDIGAK